MDDAVRTPVLCVDLDGTLIRTDLLLETLVGLLRGNPLYTFVLPFWLLRGKAAFKREIARRVRLNPAALPYREKFVEFLRAEATRRPVFLVTASDVLLATPIAAHLGFFAGVMASDGRLNLSGNQKLAALRLRFGTPGFSYAGNGWVDVPIWNESQPPIVVGAPAALVRHVSAAAPAAQIWPEPSPGWRDYLRLLRVHQWSKNLIVFVPLLTAHELGNPRLLGNSLWAFGAFCAAASLVYVLNDLCDLESDRLHPTKNLRQLASGTVSIVATAWLVPLLAALIVVCLLNAPARFGVVLGTYLAISTAYSIGIKRVVLLDVICLAGLYALRIIGGHEATGVVYSPWLLAFAMFLFFSLALVKRYSELLALQQTTRVEAAGRGYRLADISQVAMLGVSSGLVAVLVLALYVSSSAVQILYRQPLVLLLVCPLLLYWIGRVWILAGRGEMHDDPIVFTLRDWASYVVGALTMAVMALATFL